MKLTLGTAQLGVKYGTANRTGKPSRSLGAAIVRRAAEQGITTFDTARAYGDAEETLREGLSGLSGSILVITKLYLPPLNHGANEGSITEAVAQSLDASCRALGTTTLPVVLLHDWDHRHIAGGKIWECLLQYQREGRIGALGASVYLPHQAIAALNDSTIQYLQLPFNVLDWRWKAGGVDRAVAGRPEVAVFARSALLQGLLTLAPDGWPPIIGFDVQGCVRQLAELTERLGRECVADLCLAYARAQSWIGNIVVGCETLEQLEQDLEWFRRPGLTPEECMIVEHCLPRAPESLLNPTQWTANPQTV